MNKQWLIAAVAALSLPVLAHASCDDVKASIDAKIKAHNVSGYSLEVVSGDQAGDGKVVGQCEGDKKIIYTKGAGGASAGDGQSGDVAPSTPASSSSSG